MIHKIGQTRSSVSTRKRYDESKGRNQWQEGIVTDDFINSFNYRGGGYSQGQLRRAMSTTATMPNQKATSTSESVNMAAQTF